MAQHAEDREDLFAELSSASPRWELGLPGRATPVVAGIRREGWLSIYLSGDECYHFDADGALRRAFVGDKLYRTQGNTLAELTRERTATQSALLRRDLTAAELQEFFARMTDSLRSAEQQLRGGEVRMFRSEPPGEDFPLRLLERIAAILDRPPRLAAAIGGR